MLNEEQLQLANRLSFKNKEALSAHEQAACYHCKSQFSNNSIKEWVDDEQTALCPHCGVDAVLSALHPIPITADSLAELHEYWFNTF